MRNMISGEMEEILNNNNNKNDKCTGACFLKEISVRPYSNINYVFYFLNVVDVHLALPISCKYYYGVQYLSSEFSVVMKLFCLGFL